jgi:hypothetical protein
MCRSRRCMCPGRHVVGVAGAWGQHSHSKARGQQPHSPGMGVSWLAGSLSEGVSSCGCDSAG